MTWATVVIAVITIANFVLLLFLTRHVIKINRFREIVLEEKRAAEEKAAMPEPITSIPERPAPAAFESVRIEPVPPKTAQIKIALERLRAGDDAEEIAKDLGYSRSEMGILVASSKR